MTLTPEDREIIGFCILIGLAFWCWVVWADRSAEREFRDWMERRDEP